MKKTFDNWIEFLIFFLFLIPIVVRDIKEKRIPDLYIFTCLSLIIIVKIILKHDLTIWTGVNLLVGFLFLWLVWLITKGKMGLGDAKLSALIALVLGIPGWLLAIFLAAFSGSVFGLVKIGSNKMKKEDAIPFAPFLALGSITAFFLGDHLVRMYYELGN